MTENRSGLTTNCVVSFLVFASALASDASSGQTAWSADDDNAKNTATVQYDEDLVFEESLKSYPWYSTEHDSPHFLPRRPEKVERQYESTPPRERKASKPRESSPSDGTVFWWLVSTFLLVILALVGWFCYRSYQMRSTSRKFQLEEERRRRRRVETLTEEAKDYYDDLKSAALTARELGDFRRATIFLFSWILVELDKREFILLDKGKTNLEYFHELNGRESEQAVYHIAMTEFERVYFGGQPITRDEFEMRLYVLIDAFETIMSRRDDLMRIQADANESPRNSADSNFRVSSLGILALLSASVVATGCGKEYWETPYDSPAISDYPKSLNSLSTFVKYGDSQLKGGLRTTYSCRLDDYSVDAIIWLDPANRTSGGLSRSGNFVLVRPSSSIRSGSSNMESDKERDAAFEANLERYARCDPERDWRNLYVPAGNKRLYGWGDADIRFHEVGIFEIEDWLEEKPNRVFVCVFDEWNASVAYWEAALKDVQARAPEDKRADYLRECRTRIADARRSREDKRKFAMIFKEELNNRRAKAVRLLAERKEGKNHIESDDLDFIFDDNVSLEDGNGASEDFFTYSDQEGVDFGDDWSDATDERKDRPNAKKVWCRSLFIDDDVERDDRPNSVFSGDPDWISGLPPATLREWTTLAPAEGTETLVALGDVPLICRRRVGESQMIFVNSTSILSNYALIDGTNRKLVERLFREFNTEGRAQLVLSELWYGDGYEPPEYKIGPFSLTKATPFTFMTWHIIALGLFVFFAAWPIWGRAKRLATERNNNFGRHIGAFARLLKEINAVDWTREQIESWRGSQPNRQATNGDEERGNEHN